MAPQGRQREVGQNGIGEYDAKREQQKTLQPRMRAVRGFGHLCQWIGQVAPFDVGEPSRSKIYRRVSRQPAASASSTEQNQRVPLLIFISILAYQRLVGLW